LLFSGFRNFLHDPVSFAALVRPDLFTFRKGVARFETQGICIGHTLMDQGLKKYQYPLAFYSLFLVSLYSPVYSAKLLSAWIVDVPKVLASELLMKS